MSFRQLAASDISPMDREISLPFPGHNGRSTPVFRPYIVSCCPSPQPLYLDFVLFSVKSSSTSWLSKVPHLIPGPEMWVDDHGLVHTTDLRANEPAEDPGHEEVKLLCKHVMFRGILKINSHHTDNWKDKHADADWLAKAIWRRVSDERSRPKLGTAKRGSNRRRKVNCGSQILSLLISFPGVAFTFNEFLVAFKQLPVLFFIPFSLWLLKAATPSPTIQKTYTQPVSERSGPNLVTYHHPSSASILG
ncbi:hypothetical protein QBC33DRAFT_58102 [Phialemonium atrogriseum]|uniref:Uncharacterized protein n=1 Tax=Phialemonium atrogriseum TaxID=1093897 RepID=A0AAJ0C292_9PEZI|nr:uncharacterized protein QBC33DRAFT_58102 [Phialemonium atrogriseum]KAK1767763.1 hypothetical protein QBC33DRAFT_58102 [Phialemonium atrogriseum]